MNSCRYQGTVEPKSQGDGIFQSILLNNSELVIINNTNKKNYCHFQLKNGVEILFIKNKSLNIVFSDITFWFFDNIDVPAL